MEPPEVRRRAGKPVRPQLTLTTQMANDHLIIEVADDGAGIDWAALRKAAARRGLPHDTEEQLVNALFASEVTTRTGVTVVSGRGMGLAAVKNQVAAAGGSMTVISQPGTGTCFRIVLPVAKTAAAPGAETPNATSSKPVAA